MRAGDRAGARTCLGATARLRSTRFSIRERHRPPQGQLREMPLAVDPAEAPSPSVGQERVLICGRQSEYRRTGHRWRCIAGQVLFRYLRGRSACVETKPAGAGLGLLVRRVAGERLAGRLGWSLARGAAGPFDHEGADAWFSVRVCLKAGACRSGARDHQSCRQLRNGLSRFVSGTRLGASTWLDPGRD